MVTYTAEHRARFALAGNIRFIYSILEEDHYKIPISIDPCTIMPVI